jgi:hypothetical protein
MAGFSSYDDLISEATVNGKIYKWDFYKNGTTSPAAGIWYSLARRGGYPIAITDGAAGSGTPGAGGTALTNATGSIFLENQTPDIKVITHIEANANAAQNLMLYDRLVHVSGVVNNSTGSKNVGSAALPRYTDGKGVQVWLEYTTPGTTTASIVHLDSYTDNDNNTAQSCSTTITAPATAMTQDSMFGPIPLATGDLGVRSVETMYVDTASTAGVVQVVLMRPIASLYIPANTHAEKDLVLQFTALPRMYDGASLCLMYRTTATTATNLYGSITIAWG